MTNEEIRTLGKAYLQCQRARVGCELQMQKLMEHRLIHAGVATREIVADDDDAGRAANKFKKTKIIILDEKKAEKIREQVQESREYKNLVKYKASLKREEQDFLYTATQVTADSPIWEFAKRVKGFGDVAVMTSYTIIDTERIADSQRVVTAGRVWKYLGLVPGQRLKSGELGGFNTTLKGRWYMIRKNLVMAKDPYYGEIYRVMKALYKQRPDLVAVNGSTVKGGCEHYIAVPLVPKAKPGEPQKLNPQVMSKDMAKLGPAHFVAKFRLEAERTKIEDEIGDKIKAFKIDNKGASKKEIKGGVDELKAELERRVEAKEREIEANLLDLFRHSPKDVEKAAEEIKIQLGYVVHCPKCKDNVSVATIENVMKRPGWNKWIDEMSGRWMGKLLLSHVTEIIATGEGYRFSRHADYIPPKPEDDYTAREVIERFRESRANILMRYIDDFAETGSAQSAKDNLQSWWETKTHGISSASRTHHGQQQQQQHRGIGYTGPELPSDFELVARRKRTMQAPEDNAHMSEMVNDDLAREGLREAQQHSHDDEEEEDYT